MKKMKRIRMTPQNTDDQTPANLPTQIDPVFVPTADGPNPNLIGICKNGRDTYMIMKPGEY